MDSKEWLKMSLQCTFSEISDESGQATKYKICSLNDVIHKTHRHTSTRLKLFWGPVCISCCSTEWNGCARATLCKCARFLNIPTHLQITDVKFTFCQATITSICFEKVALQDHKCSTERNDLRKHLWSKWSLCKSFTTNGWQEIVLITWFLFPQWYAA